MSERNREEVRSFKGLVMFFVFWALIPAALAFAVVRLFDRLSKHDLLTILLVCLAALIVAVGGGAIMAVRNSRRRVPNENEFD